MATFVAEISCLDPVDDYVIRVKATDEDEARVKVIGAINTSQSIKALHRTGRGRPTRGSHRLD